MGFLSRFSYEKIIKAVLIPSAAVIKAEISSNDEKGIVCRPSELPLYCPEPKVTQCDDKVEAAWLTEIVQEKVSGLRNVIQNVVLEVKAYENVAEDYIKQGIDQADGVITYLRQENSTAPKVGAIAIGGLTGLILSLRRGYFRKLLYTTGGAVAMSAVCYPKQTSEYVEIGFVEGKKYATIAYNFAYGVKKGDPPMELPSLPQLPSSVSELWEMSSKKISSLFLDKADSADASCSKDFDYSADYGDDEEEETKKVEEGGLCRCFEENQLHGYY